MFFYNIPVKLNSVTGLLLELGESVQTHVVIYGTMFLIQGVVGIFSSLKSTSDGKALGQIIAKSHALEILSGLFLVVVGAAILLPACEPAIKNFGDGLWYCGPFPLSQKAESGTDSTARLVNQRSWFRAKDGEYTVARIDREDGEYMILPLIANTTTGPQTHGTYLWAEFDGLQKIEDRLIDGPYIHHFVEIAGDYRKEIKEFCKYFPSLKIDETV